jgi:hypothetical protein
MEAGVRESRRLWSGKPARTMRRARSCGEIDLKTRRIRNSVSTAAPTGLRMEDDWLRRSETASGSQSRRMWCVSTSQTPLETLFETPCAITPIQTVWYSAKRGRFCWAEQRECIVAGGAVVGNRTMPPAIFHQIMRYWAMGSELAALRCMWLRSTMKNLRRRWRLQGFGRKEPGLGGDDINFKFKCSWISFHLAIAD